MIHSKTARDVKIQRPFRLGKYEVTFDEYDRFAVAKGKRTPNDGKFGRGRRPVIDITFVDAQDYAAWLSEQTGKRYRLPSEAEWEYAARSGGKDEIWAGTSDEKQLAEYAVFQSLNGAGRQPQAEWSWVIRHERQCFRVGRGLLA